MTERKPAPPKTAKAKAAWAPLLARRLARARAALLWERLVPLAWPLAAIPVLFVALALLNLPAVLSPWSHGAGLLVFALGFLAAAGHLVRRLRWPRRAEALRRLEEASGLGHRPLALLEDTLAAGANDPGTRAVWEAHRRRTEALVSQLRVGSPIVHLARHDPWGLRQAALLMLALGLVVAGPDWQARLARAVDPGLSGMAGEAPVMEAWLSPPAYTGLPPVFITRPASQPTPAAATPAKAAPLAVPVGSVFSVKVHGARAPSVLLDKAVHALSPLGRTDHQLSLPITGGQTLAVVDGRRTLGTWTLALIPDAAPTVSFTSPPEAGPRLVTQFEFSARDDYGVTGLAAQIERDGVDPASAPAPMEVPLSLPAASARESKGKIARDLTSHPWAGLPVLVRLVARDGAGQEGLSEAAELVLPERSFQNPLAAALIAERKILVASPASRHRVAATLDGIASAIGPDDADSVAFLGLRAAFWRLVHNQHPEALAGVVDLLWDVALRIEDGDRGAVTEAVDEARQALQKALESGASDQEIDRLTEQLKTAMGKYLQRLAADAARRAAEGGPQATPGPDDQTVTPRDLERMLDKARDLGKTGAREAARDMLSNLQQMLENLSAAPRPGKPRDGASDAAADVMNKLTDLLERQQHLRDQSFRSGQPDQRRGERDQSSGGTQNPGKGTGKDSQSGTRKEGSTPGAEGREGGDLASQQEALRQALGEIMRKLGQANGKVPESLSQAERAMRDARDALQRGELGEAVSPQGEALNQLRAGARNMATEEQQRAGAKPEQQQGEGSGTDPLGRPKAATSAGDGGQVKVPTDSDLQRARAIQDELQRRAGERARPPGELDYIERLLKRF